MNFTMDAIAWMTILPLAGAFLLAVSRMNGFRSQWTAFGVSLLPALISLRLWSSFDPSEAGIQMVNRATWIQALGVNYFTGIDGLGLLMVLLTSILVPFALAFSRNDMHHPHRFFALMLALQSGLYGAFTTLNFFHWFLFWELSLLPAFFLIRLWGGKERAAASLQFFIYTMVGSIALLIGFLAIYARVENFDFIELARMRQSGEFASGMGTWTTIAFVGIFLGFAVKVPIMPFHTWLPATYAEAPTSVTMLLTGAMSKMGVYGLVRILLPLFPEQLRDLAPLLLVLTVATIVLAALAASVQTDLKRVFAYSSVNHLGYCMLGILAVALPGSSSGDWELARVSALNGVLLQMFNHGIIAAALFCMIGIIESRTGGERNYQDFSGLRQSHPRLAGFMGIAMFASLGLPGLSGFVGEFLIFRGAFAVAPWYTALACLGLLVTALFLLNVYQAMFHGPMKSGIRFKDLSSGETVLLLPALVLIVLLGWFPQIIIGLFNSTVMQLARSFAF